MEAQERTVFRCTVCDWYYLSEEGLWNHVQLHDIPDEKRKSHCEELITSSVLYECEQCNDQRLYEEDGYNQHIIEYHDEPPTEQVSIKCECTDCGDIFANHDLLLQHVEESHRIIACRICAATFNDDKELDNHKITHHLEKCYSCPYCLEAIPDVNTYKNHADLCSKQQYSCEICNTEFASLIFLEKHNRQVHPEDIRQSEDVVADSNNGEIIIDNIVPAHDEIKMEISVEEPTLQPVSHDQAHDDMLLVVSDVHEELHADNSSITDKEPHVTIDKKEYRRYNVGNRTVFECLICNATFDKINAYRWHKIKTHIGKTLICPHCGKSLWKLNDFQNHVAKCAIKKFPCEFCNRRFPTKEAVEVHIKERHKLQVQQMIGLPMVTMPNVDCKCECTVCGDISENRELHFGHMKANHGHKVICDYCTLTFTDDDELASHTKSDHNQASQKCYECTLCGIMFSSQQRYNMHKQVIHQRIQHKCSKCLQQFYKTHTFLEHKAQCVGRILSCKFCDAKFSTDKALRKHLQRNHKVVEQASEPNIIQSIKSECPICGEVFGDGFQLSKHVQESHQKTVCTICSKTFDNDDELFSHKLTSHQEPAPDTFECPHCAKHFRSSALLNSHQESCGSRCLRECNICHKKYVKLSQLIEHTSSCHPEMIYSCRFCPRKFIEEAALLRHADNCAERIYSCSQCDASRKTLDEFKRHVALTGHAAEPVIAPELFTHTEPRFKCTRCPKTFFMRRTLLQHSQSHDEEYERERQRVSMADPKNIKECEICHIPFSNRQRLRHHMLTVHEEPKHKCAKCGKAFHYKGELNRHELVHAKNESGYLPPQEKKPKTAVEPASIPTCEQCNIQFLNKRIRHHHMVTVHSEPKFKCPYCPKVYYFLNTLERHQKTHSKIGAEKMCKTCGLQFETAAKKWRHMLNVHQIPRYRCPECADPFMYKRRLRRHMKNRHKKEIPVMSHGPYSMLSKNCSKCNLEFADMDEKRKHMQENHAELLVWCSQCPKAFGHKGSLQRHEQRVHGALPVRQVNAILEANALLQPNTVPDGPKGCNRTQWAKNCWDCGLKFTTSTQSNAHMREKHQDRLFKCLECPSTFINERSLVLHNRSHNKVPRTVTEKTCSKCGVMFPTKSEKYKHMMEDHADSMYKCSQCPKLFVYKAKLEKHEKTPHDTMEEKPPQKLVAETACSICGLQLETRPKKRHHMLTAHSEPKFECSLCGKQFYYKQLLDRHETSHRKQNKRLTDASKSDGNNINNHIVDGSYGNTAAGLQLECKADEFSIHENRADIAVDNEAYGFKPDEEKPNDNNTIQIKTEPNDTTYIIVPTQPQLIKQENSYS